MFDVLPVTSARPTDCGATCMKMLLAYYGQDVALDQLIRECNTRLIGCSAGDLKRCGIAHGLEMVAYQMDAAELIRQDRPAIIHWKHQHWCVFCGRDDGGNVVICNPDRGRYRLPPDTFAAMYTGVSLFNGEPEALPEPEPSDDSELAQAARILLGVDE